MAKRLALLDKKRCVGCQSCMFACARRHGVGGLASTSNWVRSAGGIRKGFVVIVCRACPAPPCSRVYPTDVALEALATTGFEWSTDDLTRFGAEVLHRKYVFKQREGFDLSALRIPGRILETPTPLGKIDEEFMRQSIQAYGRAV